MQVLQREKANAEISQYAATQGRVLMENKDQALPISQEKGTKVALYGNGVYNTIKGRYPILVVQCQGRGKYHCKTGI